MTTVDIVGGGAIGLSIAWRCAQNGHEVTVYDPAPGSGASHVAAGMLAPTCETYFGEERLDVLLHAGGRRWPAFAAEIAAAGFDIGYRAEGTLAIAGDPDGAAALRRLVAYQRERNLGRDGTAGIMPLDRAEVRRSEPALTPDVTAAAFAPDDHQVDPRLTVAALLELAVRAGVRFVPQRVSALGELDASYVILAAGVESAALLDLPVRPVKGQQLRLRRPARLTAPPLRHVIRGWVHGREVAVVPRRDGEVVVGATMEEQGFDTGVTAQAVRELLSDATALVPQLDEYSLVETQAGLRPGTPDNAPLIGPWSERVIVATGHYRHGVLLAPYTAHVVVEAIRTGAWPAGMAAFAPDRALSGRRLAEVAR